MNARNERDANAEMGRCPPCTGETKHWRVIDESGKRYGRLVVVAETARTGTGRNRRWSCRCDCGKQVSVLGNSLRRGETRSCGCLQREIARRAGDRTRTHGLTKTSTYNIWDSMHQRCSNPNRKDYPRYGGRGVVVCERWGAFEAFLEDMGERPPGLTLERRDVDGAYSKSNCRWATQAEQARNMSTNRILQFDGIRQCMADWAKTAGITVSTLAARLRRGWTVGDAITKPVPRKPNV